MYFSISFSIIKLAVFSVKGGGGGQQSCHVGGGQTHSLEINFVSARSYNSIGGNLYVTILYDTKSYRIY